MLIKIYNIIQVYYFNCTNKNKLSHGALATTKEGGGNHCNTLYDINEGKQKFFSLVNCNILIASSEIHTSSFNSNINTSKYQDTSETKKKLHLLTL